MTDNNIKNATVIDAAAWVNGRVRHDEIDKYLDNGKSFIDENRIDKYLAAAGGSDAKMVRDILQKSLAIESLTQQETAVLLNVTDTEILAEMEQTAGLVKKKVYDNRIVTFAPLYLGNLCINNCLYCGFRANNGSAIRRKLTIEEVRQETEVLAGQIGHKRLIVVYGEHPETDVNYIAETLRAIADVEAKTRNGFGQIRRANVNAAPMQIEELRLLNEIGIGTYQVFQETYHRQTYSNVHPPKTVKGNYLWRLYSMHRAMEAGIDDVGLGALFGLYDWKFEVMALIAHARELESKFGVGPHTISFPRLEPADNTPFAKDSPYQVSDDDFRKLVTVIRLAVPYTGMILTARESAEMRRTVLPLGCTQMDASTQIGVGSYSETDDHQHGDRQQFILGDVRSLEDVVRELAEDGIITSFCTAGYRCGRTGTRIMDMLKCGKEGHLCKLNAVITFREWLDDFAGPETMATGEKLIAREIQEIKEQMPAAYDAFLKMYEKTQTGQRDMYF